MMIAENVVKQYHGDQEAKRAAEYFDRTVRARDLEDKDYEVIVYDEIAKGRSEIPVLEICKKMRPNESNNQIKDLIKGGALRIDGQKIEDLNMKISVQGSDLSIQFGKRGFFKLVRESNDNTQKMIDAPGAKPQPAP